VTREQLRSLVDTLAGSGKTGVIALLLACSGPSDTGNPVLAADFPRWTRTWTRRRTRAGTPCAGLADRTRLARLVPGALATIDGSRSCDRTTPSKVRASPCSSRCTEQRSTRLRPRLLRGIRPRRSAAPRVRSPARTLA
jgi:hypothetical protein